MVFKVIMIMQLNIPDKINKKLKIYKIKNDLKNLQEAVIKILEETLKDYN